MSWILWWLGLSALILFIWCGGLARVIRGIWWVIRVVITAIVAIPVCLICLITLGAATERIDPWFDRFVELVWGPVGAVAEAFRVAAKPVVDMAKVVERAFPIYTVQQVMETLPDEVRDRLRLVGKPCPGLHREVQGHLWAATIRPDNGAAAWKCRVCQGVCRTFAVAEETGTFYEEDPLPIQRHRIYCDDDIPGSPGCIC